MAQRSRSKKSVSPPPPSSGRTIAAPRKRNAAANNTTAKNKKTNGRANTKTSANIKNAEQAGIAEKSSLNSMALNIAPFILIIVAIYLFVSFVITGAESVGIVGFLSRNIFYGLFGTIAILIPIFMGNIGIFLKKDIGNGFFRYRIIFSAICLVLYAAIFHLPSLAQDIEGKIAYGDPGEIFEKGINSNGGGIFGGYFAETLGKLVGPVGAWIFILPLALVFSTFLFGYTPLGFIKQIVKLIKDYRNDKNGFERNIIVKEQDPNHRFKSKTHRYKIVSQMNMPQRNNGSNGTNRPFQSDIPIDLNDPRKNNKKSKKSEINFNNNPFANSFTDELNEIEQNENTNTDDINIVNKVENTENAENRISYATPTIIPESELVASGENNENNIDKDIDELFSGLDAINGINGRPSPGMNLDIDADADFADFDLGELKNIEPVPQIREDEPDIDENAGKNKTSIKFETSKVFEDDEKPIKREYKLPPISYLTKDTSTVNVDISDELKTTAQKIIETFASFGVKTKIIDYSRGPSITRYEISPEAGVKVSAIVSLANDIALNLAAEVRIEAPIPGKAAIGVEVPNKVREIVYLRTLLEKPKFTNAASKITICLGEDVAGEPIYSDIAKMPHLLIAGATNMGKSVGINSIITSILYKATPNEVKLILVDPKKVELNIYNGIPHLLVPVISEPKKAAGALSWAVNEMEQRYMFIEERGVRDFRAYNEAIADDPLSEPLPQIVIIIDELADLMLTAPADVEQSVNRLAAKARAAGMHLIVATQRPSVDVITGLIKANIPTRIAFTVVAPQDSRTIINMGGAEKLIGLGDMLYVPTGSKPIRVQGAYVSDKDVLTTVEFWKKQSDGQYDENILNEIEQEAARCNTKGAKIQNKDEETNADDEFRKDSALKAAIEIAIDTGRISTSLLQTKLSLGYARAARIINTMEKMNIIGPFEGSKPRKVLISKQEFIEMTMNKDGFE